jgi:nitrite reductase/ring-hydroxylating ferredoxin subunit/uncharacterized membrane protein
MGMTSGMLSRFWDRLFGSVERQEWMDRIGDPLEESVEKAFEAGGVAGQKTADFLHGTWFGRPLHPALTNIPIGAWTTAVVLDVLDDTVSHGEGYEEAATDAVIFGIAGAFAAAVTGLTDYQHLSPKQRRIGLVHAALNSGSLAIMASSYLARARGNFRRGKSLARLGWAVMFAGASFGAHMVYRQRVGITHADERELPRDFVPVLRVEELREDEPRRVIADDVRVVLVRHAGRIYALGEECSHMGGPLAEGKIVGGSIKCPWHGSRFALEDGHVEQGPATEIQPCFEVRIRDGQIELRRAERGRELPVHATARAEEGAPAPQPG